METGRTWKQDRQEGPSGQDTAGGINKKQPPIYCLWTLYRSFISIEKYEQMGIKLSPGREQLQHGVSVLLGKLLPGKHLLSSKDFLD